MATQISGSLISRNYGGFRGVDFSNRGDEVALNRSPDALNVWKNYKNSNGKCIETRPDLELLKDYNDTIFGLFFYKYKGELQRIVHCGNKLLVNDKTIYESMAKHKSIGRTFNGLLYIMDSESYLVYNGVEVNVVEGFIPITTISKSPSGGGTIYQDVNLLTGLRKNTFVADGSSTEYFVDSENIDADYKPKVWIDNKEVTTFTVDYTAGKITFNTAPTEPLTTGQDNVVIQFSKTVPGAREKIEKCTLVTEFDNRLFFGGNPDYPNMLYHCKLDDPTYCGDVDYYPEGVNDSNIKALVTGNNALWVMKEPSQSNTTIFYHNPTIDATEGKIYPSSHSSISTGCVATGINFNDDIVFFSERGMEAISSDVTTEQVIEHRSSLIDSKLLSEPNYKNLLLEEWEGYLLVIIDNKVFLADSKNMVNIVDRYEYEWFYWEFNSNITSTHVKDGVLYLCSDNKIYTLTKTDTNIEAYWTTLQDEFKYPGYQKTTNKKGCVSDIEGSEVTVSVRTDNNSFEKIDTYKNVKGYVVPRIKKKKWKAIQLKFSSNKPFSLYSSTLEAYVGSYVKR